MMNREFYHFGSFLTKRKTRVPFSAVYISQMSGVWSVLRNLGIGRFKVQINNGISFKFSLIVFIEFTEFNTKNICHYSTSVQNYHPAASCVRDQDATTVLVRHM